MQSRQLRNELAPDPDRESLGRRVLESCDVVEQIVVEAMHQRIDGAAKVGEVDHPAEVRVDGTADCDFAAKRVAVDATTLVSFRHIRKKVCGFEAKVFYELDDVGHRAHLSR